MQTANPLLTGRHTAAPELKPPIIYNTYKTASPRNYDVGMEEGKSGGRENTSTVKVCTQNFIHIYKRPKGKLHKWQ